MTSLILKLIHFPEKRKMPGTRGLLAVRASIRSESTRRFFSTQDGHSSIFSLPPPNLVIQATATFNFPMVQKHLNQSTATRARRRARLRGCSDPTLVCLAALSWIVAVSLLRKIVLVACPVVRCLLLTRIILSHRTQTKQRRRRC